MYVSRVANCRVLRRRHRKGAGLVRLGIECNPIQLTPTRYREVVLTWDHETP